MRKALILTPHYPPFSRVGTTKRVVNFARYLPAYEWEPVIITMDWGYRNNPDRDAFGNKIYSTPNLARTSWQAYQKAELSSRKPGALKRVLISMVRTTKNALLIPDELILWQPFAIRRFREIAHVEKPDLLFVNAPPFSPLLAGCRIHDIFKIPLVCDIRDDWNGNPLLEKRNPVLRRIERRMERRVSNCSTGIVLVTEPSCSLWLGNHPGDKGKVRLIPNGYSEDEYAAAKPACFAMETIVHTGSLEAGRSPETIIKALAALKHAGRPIQFHQYGLSLGEFRELADRYGVQDLVFFHGMVSGEEALSAIKGASMLILLPTQTAPTAVPGKAYEYLRSGKPILLVSDDNTTTQFMNQFPNVHRIKPDDDDGCREAIANARTASGTDETPSPLVRQHDRKMLTGQLAKLFDEVMDAHTPRGNALESGNGGI